MYKLRSWRWRVIYLIDYAAYPAGGFRVGLLWPFSLWFGVRVEAVAGWLIAFAGGTSGFCGAWFLFCVQVASGACLLLFVLGSDWWEAFETGERVWFGSHGVWIFFGGALGKGVGKGYRECDRVWDVYLFPVRSCGARSVLRPLLLFLVSGEMHRQWTAVRWASGSTGEQ